MKNALVTGTMVGSLIIFAAGLPLKQANGASEAATVAADAGQAKLLARKQAEENNLVAGSKIVYLGAAPASKTGQLGKLPACLCDADWKTGVKWREGIDEFPVGLEIELSKLATVSMIVCRWRGMPAEYVLEARVDSAWQVVASVAQNNVLGPKIKLHLFAPVQTDKLRLRISKTVSRDCQERPGGKFCAIREIGIYDADNLPAHIETFLAAETPRMVATAKWLEKIRVKEDYTPDPEWLNTPIRTWVPITYKQYVRKPEGRDVNEKAFSQRRLMLKCAWAYAKTGDEAYARKAREVMFAIIDHHDKYQGFRFFGIRWAAVMFQEPAYVMEVMNKTYDLIASSACMSRKDKLRFVFFSLDNAEFQYRILRDRVNVNSIVWRSNKIANSFAEIVLTAYYFKDFAETRRWVDVADQKVGVFFKGFLDDGYWHECSPSHTVYSLRGLGKYYVGKHLLGEPVWTKKHHGKTLEFVLESLAKTMSPLGEIPSIGNSTENDRPLLKQPFAGEHLRAPLYLIGRGDLLKMMKDSGEPPCIAGLELNVSERTDPPYKSVLLPDAGLAVLRDGWERDDAYLLLNFSPHAHGHFQYDNLSIIMVANGHHWIPDAAVSPHYDLFPEQLTWHIQTIAHNTVMANGASQKKCPGELVLWHTDEKVDMVSAQHTKGYEGLVHRRTIVHPKGGYFLIHDTLWPTAEKPFDLCWLLHIYGDVQSQSKGRLCCRNGDKELLVLSEEIGTAPGGLFAGNRGAKPGRQADRAQCDRRVGNVRLRTHACVDL